MIRIGVVGLGKMGLSHLAMLNAHPDVMVVGVCDRAGYVLSVLGKYTGLPTFSSMEDMLAATAVDAVVICTPSSLHAPMVATALGRGLHVFCEKPFCLDPEDSARLTELAEREGCVTQVGYHNRYIATFQETHRLLAARAIGRVTHVLAEAYGPVVLKPQGGTWRSRRREGGGSLYDYAAHPLNLVNWYLGEPTRVFGTILGRVHSSEIDDEVFSTLRFADDTSAHLSVNWSDESQRKMTTKLTFWGTDGRINVDRQECQVYLRDTAAVPEGYQQGWNVRYTTELTESVSFYLRGEEYSAQLDDFVQRVLAGKTEGLNSFDTAAVTDRVIARMVADAAGVPEQNTTVVAPTRERGRRFRFPRLWRR